MTDDLAKDAADDEAARWEYKVIRVSVGPVAFQKYGPDSFEFEATLNEWGKAGWEAFHAQAFADSEALLLLMKRRVPPTP
jgi:hypothetical protein